MRALLAERDDLVVVTGLGSPSYDTMAAGDHDLNYYLWGAMGSAATVGLGLALAQPQRPVLVITGDGEQLMGLGALATIGVQRPANLTIAVLDNERYAETGMQHSHTARRRAASTRSPPPAASPGRPSSTSPPASTSVRSAPDGVRGPEPGRLQGRSRPTCRACCRRSTRCTSSTACGSPSGFEPR